MRPGCIFLVRHYFNFSVCSRLNFRRNVWKIQSEALSELSKTWVLSSGMKGLYFNLFFFFCMCIYCLVSAVHFIRNVIEEALIWGSNCFCSIISTVNTWASFLLIREKNILVIVNSHAHAQALATSNGKLLWGLADCHHFDSLSSISPEQQWSSYAESIVCSQPIYRETAITFYHGWEPSSCFLLNLPFQIPVLD